MSTVPAPRMPRPRPKVMTMTPAARGDIVDTADFHFLPKPFSLGQLASKVKEVTSAGS